MPSVTVAYAVKTGSKNENPIEAGVSHFLEHFVFKGTKKYPSSKEVMRAMDSIGAEHNAATSKESTTYWVKTAVDNLSKAVEMIGGLVYQDGRFFYHAWVQTKRRAEREKIDGERNVGLEQDILS